LGLAGLTPQNDLPGTDLAPLIQGKTTELDREGVLLEFVAELRPGVAFYDAVWRGFRSERFKYTVKGDKNGAEPWEFFDLQHDPYELRNLLDEPAWMDEISRHHQLLRNRLEETLDPLVLLPAWGHEGWNVWST
jgi:arylsulfatase A-like enzyme